MNKILIVDASASDNRVMSSLLMKAGYDPITAESIEAGKVEVAKLPPGAVVITATKFRGGTARELINWMKTESYKFPVIAVVDKLNPMELIELKRDWGAVNVIQRPAIDKQLLEMVERYIRPESVMAVLGDDLIPRQSENYRGISQAISKIGVTNANAIVFGEIGMGKEQVALQIYEHSSRSQKPIIL